MPLGSPDSFLTSENIEPIRPAFEHRGTMDSSQSGSLSLRQFSSQTQAQCNRVSLQCQHRGI